MLFFPGCYDFDSGASVARPTQPVTSVCFLGRISDGEMMGSMVRALTIVLVWAVLVGCAPHRWLEVRTGTYTRIRGSDKISQAPARKLQGLAVDGETNRITLTFADGYQLTLPYETRSRVEWPAGCPTNHFSHYMEVLDLDADMVRIGALSLRNPILVRNCPAEPDELVLRQYGAVGGAGSAADGSCLIFSSK
jgi:hypothetical protein